MNIDDMRINKCGIVAMQQLSAMVHVHVQLQLQVTSSLQ